MALRHAPLIQVRIAARGPRADNQLALRGSACGWAVVVVCGA
jgi:hypothetical protein